MTTITGLPAISVAEILGLTLSRYASHGSAPMDEPRTGLTVAEARVLAREDPSLIWISVVEVAKAIGDDQITALRGEADGRDDLQRLICERALAPDEWILEDEMRSSDRLSASQETRIRRMLRADCRAACALAIVGAHASAVRS